MKTLRTAKEIFDEELSGEPLTEESVIEVIKIVQKETINETVRECAQNASVNVFREGDDYIAHIKISSILLVAKKLIKKL